MQRTFFEDNQSVGSDDDSGSRERGLTVSLPIDDNSSHSGSNGERTFSCASDDDENEAHDKTPSNLSETESTAHYPEPSAISVAVQEGFAYIDNAANRIDQDVLTILRLIQLKWTMFHGLEEGQHFNFDYNADYNWLAEGSIGFGVLCGLSGLVGVLTIWDTYWQQELNRQQYSATFLLRSLIEMTNQAIKAQEAWLIKLEAELEKSGEKTDIDFVHEASKYKRKRYRQLLKLIFGKEEGLCYAERFSDVTELEADIRRKQALLYYYDGSIARPRLWWRRWKLKRRDKAKFCGLSREEIYPQNPGKRAKLKQEVDEFLDQLNLIDVDLRGNQVKLNYLARKDHAAPVLLPDEYVLTSKQQKMKAAVVAAVDPSGKWRNTQGVWAKIKLALANIHRYLFTYAFYFWCVWAFFYFKTGITSYIWESFPKLFTDFTSAFDLAAKVGYSGQIISDLTLSSLGAGLSFGLPLLFTAFHIWAEWYVRSETPEERKQKLAHRNKRIILAAQQQSKLLHSGVALQHSLLLRAENCDQNALGLKSTKQEQSPVGIDTSIDIGHALAHKIANEQKWIERETELNNAGYKTTETERVIARLGGKTLSQRRGMQKARAWIEGFFTSYIQTAFISWPVLTFLGMVGLMTMIASAGTAAVPVITIVCLAVLPSIVGIFSGTARATKADIAHDGNLHLLQQKQDCLKELALVEREVQWLELQLKANYQQAKESKLCLPNILNLINPVIGMHNLASGTKFYNDLRMDRLLAAHLLYLAIKYGREGINYFGGGMLITRFIVFPGAVLAAIAAISGAAAATLAGAIPIAIVLGAVAFALLYIVFRMWSMHQNQQQQEDKAVVETCESRLLATRHYRDFLDRQLTTQQALKEKVLQDPARAQAVPQPASKPWFGLFSRYSVPRSLSRDSLEKEVVVDQDKGKDKVPDGPDVSPLPASGLGSQVATFGLLGRIGSDKRGLAKLASDLAPQIEGKISPRVKTVSAA